MNVNRCQDTSFKGFVTSNVNSSTRDAIQPLISGLTKAGGDRYLHKVKISGETTSVSLIDMAKGVNHVVRSIMLSTKYLENIHRQNILINWAKKYNYTA